MSGGQAGVHESRDCVLSFFQNEDNNRMNLVVRLS